jgi:hypothetical protein
MAGQEHGVGKFGGSMAVLAAQRRKSLFYGKNGGSVPPYLHLVNQKSLYGN